MNDKCPHHVRRNHACPICARISQRLMESEFTAPHESVSVVRCSALFDILRAETYWTAGIFNSWTEGRGAREFRNSSIKSVEGKFRSKAEALEAAENAIKDRMLPGVCWGTAEATASFRIPHKTSEKLGEIMDAMLSNELSDRKKVHLK